MSAADESENLLDHSTERISPNGWRVISNPTRRPEPGADELRTLIQSMQTGRRLPGRRKVDKTEPPEAA
nr:hypothetical protein [uncultured bacterium]